MKFYQEIFHIIPVPSPTIPHYHAHILHPRTASVQTPSQSVETRSRNAHPPCTDIKNLHHSQPLQTQKHIILQPQEKKIVPRCNFPCSQQRLMHRKQNQQTIKK